MFELFVEGLRLELEKPLPGKIAHEIMRPYLSLSPSLNVPTSPFAKSSAVMCLLFLKNNMPHLIFIERPTYDGVHSGQLAFPGGKPEANDIDLMATALRETHEEIGIDNLSINHIGKLTDVYVWASNFLVTPYLGYLKEIPKYLLNEYEVARVLEIPIPFLMRNDIVKEKPMQSKLNSLLNAPYFDIEGKELWGATAMMVSEILTIIRSNEKLVAML